MCTRYLLLRNAQRLAAGLGVERTPDIGPRYNAAPRQSLPIVRRERRGAKREAVLARWGLEPPAGRASARGPLVNARAETAATRPTFREAFRTRRCLVPADGFYEWERTGGTPLPWLFTPAETDELLLLGGLWAPAATADGAAEDAFTLLTTVPNALVAPLHDRMPVLIPAGAAEAWLDPATPSTALEPLLVPWPAARLHARPVHPRLNRVGCDEPGCLDAPPPCSRQLDLGLG